MKNKFDTVEKVEKFLNTIPQFVEKTGVERCRLLLKELGVHRISLRSYMLRGLMVRVRYVRVLMRY